MEAKRGGGLGGPRMQENPERHSKAICGGVTKTACMYQFGHTCCGVQIPKNKKLCSGDCNKGENATNFRGADFEIPLCETSD